ncbi:MAG TPA: matrixin family metalloprotease [Thermoanaerobaculia bacterium]|nr:matrixin family metalloprotease [Thermoanaerobaculia bacterium]
MEPELLGADEVGRLWAFLLRFGFIKHGEFERRSKRAFRRGILNLKDLYGIDKEALLSEEILALTEQPRCGNFRFDKRLLESGCIIDGLCPNRRDLIYQFEGGFSEKPEEFEYQFVKKAFDTWQKLGRVAFRRAQEEESFDISVKWIASADDLAEIDMSGSIIAHADFPGKCARIVTGDKRPVHFDADESWGDGEYYDIQSVALHEIGHILGLEECNVESAVMFHDFKKGDVKRVLQKEDIDVYNLLYPQ